MTVFGNKAGFLEPLAFCGLARQEECFGVAGFAAQFERSEIFMPKAFGNLRAGLNPQAKLVQIIEADLAITHTLDKMVTDRLRQSRPTCDLRHLLSKHKAPQLFTQPLRFFSILRGAETLGQCEELFFFSLARLNPFFDQLDQHPIVAEPLPPRDTGHLPGCRFGQGQTTPDLLFGFHSTMLHQCGAKGRIRLLDIGPNNNGPGKTGATQNRVVQHTLSNLSIS